MKTKLKKLLGRPRLIAGLAVLVIALVWWRSGRAPIVPLAPLEVRENYTMQLEVEGRLRAGNEAFLSIQHGGKLDRLLVPVGQPVKQGQLLAVIDEVQNRSRLTSALSAYRLAAAEKSRVTQLFRSGAVSRQETDRGITDSDQKKAELEQAKRQLEESIVRAPFDGVLTLLPFREGETVPDGSRVAVVEDRRMLKMTLRLDAREVADLGEKIRVTLREIGRKDAPTYERDAKVEKPRHMASEGSVDIALLFSENLADLPLDVMLQAKIPARTYPRLVLIDPKAVVWKKGIARLAVLDAKSKLSWFSAEVGARVEGKVSVLNLEPNQKVVMPSEPAKLERWIQKQTRVAEAPAKPNQG